MKTFRPREENTHTSDLENSSVCHTPILFIIRDPSRINHHTRKGAHIIRQPVEKAPICWRPHYRLARHVGRAVMQAQHPSKTLLQWWLSERTCKTSQQVRPYLVSNFKSFFQKQVHFSKFYWMQCFILFRPAAISLLLGDFDDFMWMHDVTPHGLFIKW